MILARFGVQIELGQKTRLKRIPFSANLSRVGVGFSYAFVFIPVYGELLILHIFMACAMGAPFIHWECPCSIQPVAENRVLGSITPSCNQGNRPL